MKVDQLHLYPEGYTDWEVVLHWGFILSFYFTESTTQFANSALNFSHLLSHPWGCSDPTSQPTLELPLFLASHSSPVPSAHFLPPQISSTNFPKANRFELQLQMPEPPGSSQVKDE